MKSNHQVLQVLLQVSAAAQLCIALLNLALNRMLGWQREIAGMPLLLREVHQVHSWFITVTLGIFALFTFRFCGPMASGTNPACAWLAALIAIFWGFRTVLQVFYYSSSHWRGIPSRALIHITLLLIYSGFTIVYLLAAIGGR